jgi:hypothetical protein
MSDGNLAKSLFRDILESPIPLVAKQDITAARACDEQILMAVVIIIGKNGSNTNAVTQAHTSLFSDIDKCAIPFVLVQGIWSELIHKINVIRAVAVIVTHCDPTAVIVKVDLEPLSLFPVQELHAELDARGLGAFPEASRALG